MSSAALPAARRRSPRIFASTVIAALLAGFAVVSPVATDPAHASTGGALTTSPVNATLSAVTANGSASGFLGNAIDLPVYLGDEGTYVLEGIPAPADDLTGNAETLRDLPAGHILGTLYDPEDGGLETDEGEGLSISGGTDRVVRTPAGLRSQTVVNGLQVSLEGINDKVATVLERDVVATVGSVTTETTVSVTGTQSISTVVSDLTLLDEPIALEDGRLPEPTSRSLNINHTDPVQLMRALGVKEEDIDQYKGLINSGSLTGVFTLTAQTPETGGLVLSAHLEMRAQANAGIMGSADLRADGVVLNINVATIEHFATPEAILPTVTPLTGASIDAGDPWTLTGTGFIPGGTDVRLDGIVMQLTDVAADGTTLTVAVPADLPGGFYDVSVITVGGTANAGQVRVIGEDTVPLRLDSVTPTSIHDDAVVSLSGAGLTGDYLTVKVTDADGHTFAVPADAITTTATGLSLELRLPEGLALGEANIIVELPGESAEVAVTIVPLTLDPIPASGSANVIGLQDQSHAVPLTVDNSSAMTWTAPALNNPAGTAASRQILTLDAPGADETGAGSIQDTDAGITGSAARTFESLTASATASGYELRLPAPWTTFFGDVALVNATSLEVTASATSHGSTNADVQLDGLRVLGETVPLVDGRLTGSYTATIHLNRDALRETRPLDGTFFSAANQAYDRMLADSFATLTVTVSPVNPTQSGDSAQAAAFQVDADITYRYSGENGGWLSTRARHGSGDHRDGRQVNLYDATVAQVSVTAPAAVTPDVVTATPRYVLAGDTVTVTGRAFSQDAIVLFGTQHVTPEAISADGTELTFIVPEQSDDADEQIMRVRTASGDSATSRSLVWKAAPEFTQQPQDATARLGQEAVFSVAVAGVPAPQLQWQREVDGSWQDIAGETGAHLVVTGGLDLNGARYRVVASNEVDSIASSPATLTIESEPAIGTHPADVTGTAGYEVEFTVEAIAVPAATVTWQIDRGEGFVTIPDVTGETLNLLVTAADNGAQVRAVATNAIGTVISDPATLTVLYAPVVTLQPADITVRSGETATFTSAAESNPAADVHWEFRHALGGTWLPVDDTEHPSALTSTLELPTELNFDGLRFRAVFVADGFNPVVSDPAALTVRPAVTEPGAVGASSLASPLSIGVPALIGEGQAVGGAMAGFINGYLANGVEITEPGVFVLPEVGTPEGAGIETVEYPAGIPSGAGVGDIPAGASYGDVTVETSWNEDGIQTSTTVASVTVDHHVLDEKGRVGQVIGLDEIVYVEDVFSRAVALDDNDADTYSDATIGLLRVLGTEIGEADGLVDGRLTAPITRSVDIVIEDPNDVTSTLGLDLSVYLTNDVLGQATATVEVTVSQPHETTQDTAFAIGLLVEVRISLEVELETQGGDRGVFETIELTTNGLQDSVEVVIASSTAARNGAELPDPDDGTGGEGPGNGDPYPAEDPDEPVEVDHYTPTRIPQRLVSNPTANPATGRSFTWRTADEVTDSVIEYRVGGSDPVVVPAITGDAVTRTVTHGSDAGTSWAIRTHRVTLTGLTPATEYEFRVGDGEDAWSPWRTFTTASAVADPFTFLYVGDAQNDLRAYWGAAIRQAYAQVPDARLVLHAGDMINNGDNDLEWAEWFDAAPDEFASVLQWPVAGNHEYKTDSGRISDIWHDSFTLPNNGPQADLTADACTIAFEQHIAGQLAGVAYYYDYQGVRFVNLQGTWAQAVLNPPLDVQEAAGCDESVQATAVMIWLDMQARWLDQVLADNPHQWSVLSIHEPLYSVSVGRDNTYLRDAFGPVIEAHNVDLVLQGHDHTYGRGHLFANEVDGHPGLSTGPEYAVSVLGPKDYVIDRGDVNNWTANGANRVAVYEKTRTYQAISVDGGYLSYTAYAYPSNEVVDFFEICKSADGGKFVATGGASLPAGCSLGGQEQVDRSELAAAVEEAEGIDRAKYTEESLAELDAALAQARNVLNATAPTQGAVDGATQALDAALAGLILRDSDDGTGDGDGDDDGSGDGDAKPTVTVRGDLVPGGVVTVTGAGLPAQKSVVLELHSDPVVLGTATTDAAGGFTVAVTIPSDVEPGVHTLVVFADGVEVASTAVTISAAITDGGDGNTGGGDDDGNGNINTGGSINAGQGGLSNTGPGSLMAMLAVALLFVGVGAVLLWRIDVRLLRRS